MPAAKFSPEASKRICDHMNEDHTDALAYYVQHYAKQPANPKDCLMVSIDSSAMVIEIQGNNKTKEEVRIPFDPPLSEAREARVRLIDMMWESVHALGMSRYQVTKYKFDLGQLGTIIACFVMYWIFLTPVPLTPVEPYLRSNISPFFQLLCMSLPPLAHFLETQLLMVPLLKKHRVPTAKLRFQWNLACLVAGGPAVRSFKKLVEEEKQAIDSGKKGM